MKTPSSTSLRPKHVIPAVLLVILTLAVLSSVSASVSVSAITQYTFLSHTMCKNVTDKGVCQGETHVFDAKDQYAVVWFKIKMGETGQLGSKKAIWYYQNGVAEKTTIWDPVDVEKGDTWTSWNSISIRDHYATWRGFWRVEVFGPQGELLFTDEFTIGPYYEVRVGIEIPPDTIALPIRVDGENYGEIKVGEGKKLGFAPGTSHKLTVQKEITANEGVRWAIQENAWDFSGEGSHSFAYEEQYELSIVTDPTGAVAVTGAGWYQKGATANIGQIPETLDVSTGTRFVRQAVMLDNQGISTPPTTITMDKPHTIKIQYQRQYYLTVTSAYGSPQGEGWYGEFTSAEFSVTSPLPVEGFQGILGAKYVFDHWSGDVAATTATASVTMDGPKTAKAEWRTDNTTLYIIIGVILCAIAIIVALLLMRRKRVPTPTPTYQPPSPSPAVPQPPPTVTPMRSPATPPGVQPPTGKFCVNCGAPLPTHATLCNKCGSKQ
jgi:hypothetical protein